MAVENEIGGAGMHALPENCIANALSLTNPKDACRLSLVASIFHSAAQFDAVWERFLPPDYRDVISQAAESSDLVAIASKKDLFFRLCDHPVIIHGGAKSFSLEKRSGKKCYMLAARSLNIVWSDDTRYWNWSTFPGSRFPEVAELLDVCWLEIRGTISTKMLSPDTNYAAYLVFAVKSNMHGFESEPATTSVGISGHEAKTKTVSFDLNGADRPWNKLGPWRLDLDHNGNRVAPRRMGLFAHGLRQFVSSPSENSAEYPKPRGDNWMEIELGEIFIPGGEEDDSVEMSLMEVKAGRWKSGIIVQGIEIRPNEAKL